MPLKIKKSRGTPAPAPPPPPPGPGRSRMVSLSMSSDSEESVEPLVLLPPDGGYGWVIVATCFLMNVLSDGAIYSFGYYQKSVREHFKKDAAAVALLASLCSGFYYVAGPLWGAVGNRWGFRTVSVIGSVISGVAFMACYYIEEYGLFIFVYGVVLGAASGAVYMATMISVGFYFERWRGVATSLTSCGSGVGILVLPMCYKVMSSFSGFTWRWILMLNAIIYALVLALSLLLKPLKPIPVSMVRTERTVRFQDEASETALPHHIKKDTKGKQMAAQSSHTLRQLHASQTSFSPSVAFDAISMTSRAFPRSGPDAKDMQAGSRPMYRDDIFYGAGSSRLSVQMATRLTASLSPTDVMETAEPPAPPRKRCMRCRVCPHAVQSTLTALLHHSILSNTVFLMFAASQVFFMFGYFTPYLFSQDQALKAGLEPHMAEWMLPTLGMANAVGRGLAGILCEVPGVSALQLSCSALTLGSIIVAATCAAANPAYQLFASAAYGFFIAPFMAMKSLILVDFLGIEKLTNSFGLLLMFQGIAVMIGPPLSGWIYDTTKSYLYVYIISGSFLLIASLTPYLMYPLAEYEKRKEMRLLPRSSS